MSWGVSKMTSVGRRGLRPCSGSSGTYVGDARLLHQDWGSIDSTWADRLRPKGSNTQHRHAGAGESSQGDESSHTASGISTAGSHAGGEDD